MKHFFFFQRIYGLVIVVYAKTTKQIAAQDCCVAYRAYLYFNAAQNVFAHFTPPVKTEEKKRVKCQSAKKTYS